MSNETIEAFKDIQAEELRVFKAKNKDYGDSFKEDGVLGVMIREKDKINRSISLIRKGGEREVKDESLRDTFIDLGNYAAMAIMTLDSGGDMSKKKEEVISLETMAELMHVVVYIEPVGRLGFPSYRNATVSELLPMLKEMRARGEI